MDFSIILKQITPTEIELPTETMTVSGTFPLVLEGGIKYDESILDTADEIKLEIDDVNKDYWSFCDVDGNSEEDIIYLRGTIGNTNYTPLYLKLLNPFSPVTTLKIYVTGIKKIEQC